MISWAEGGACTAVVSALREERLFAFETDCSPQSVCSAVLRRELQPRGRVPSETHDVARREMTHERDF